MLDVCNFDLRDVAGITMYRLMSRLIKVCRGLLQIVCTMRFVLFLETAFTCFSHLRPSEQFCF